MRCLKDFLSVAMTALMLGGGNHLCNFGRVYYEEHSCKLNINLDQRFRRKCCLKIAHFEPFAQVR